jgi:EmrB/QacA subfamily drug resistance transporter
MTSRQRWVLALTSVASLMVALDILVVTTALNTIRVDLGASVAALEWTVNAYSLSFAVLLMTASVLGDRVGHRRVFISGLAVFSAASAACALAPGISWLITARVVQGAGAAMIMPVALALLAAAFPASQRARALGVFSGVTGLAVLGGPLVGGAVTEGLAWQWIFWINVPIGVVTIALVFRRIDRSSRVAASFDVPGLALVSGGALGLVWGLVRGNSAGWSSAEVIIALTAGTVLLAAFVGWELRVREPMLPMRFFRVPAFSAGNVAGFCLFGAVSGAAFFVAQFLQFALGYGPLGAGLRMLPWTATLFVTAPIAGTLVNRLGERPFIVGGLLLQGSGMAWIGLIAEPNLAYRQLVAPLVIAGCGVSMAMPAAQNAVLGAVPPGAIGKASGTFSTMRQLGGVFGIAVAAAVFSGTGGFASGQAFSDGFATAVGAAAALSFVGALAGVATPARRAKAAPAGPIREATAEGNEVTVR